MDNDQEDHQKRKSKNVAQVIVSRNFVSWLVLCFYDFYVGNNGLVLGIWIVGSICQIFTFMVQVEYWKVLDTCWKNDIFVHQKPTNIGMVRGGHKVKLNLEINGHIVKFGTMEFRQNTKELNDKIEEIYRSRYELIA